MAGTWGKRPRSLVSGVATLAALAGCSNLPPISNERTPTPTATTVSSAAPGPEPAATTTAAKSATMKCVAVSRALLVRAEAAGNVGGAANFVSGKMVEATEGWWFVAVRARTDREHNNVNGINQGRMAFVTNEPSGGTSWVPLSDQLVKHGDWDGITPSGDEITGWMSYRQAALDCLH